MIYRFGDHHLDRDRAELRRADGVVAMEPKAFSLLCLLVENHDRVVSKEEMIDVLWGGRFISDAAISTLVKMVRKAVGTTAALSASSARSGVLGSGSWPT